MLQLWELEEERRAEALGIEPIDWDETPAGGVDLDLTLQQVDRALARGYMRENDRWDEERTPTVGEFVAMAEELERCGFQVRLIAYVTDIRLEDSRVAVSGISAERKGVDDDVLRGVLAFVRFGYKAEDFSVECKSFSTEVVVELFAGWDW